MKKFILLAISFLMASMLFAGPFGLEMGMTLEEIKEKCGRNNVNHCVYDEYIIKPPRPNSIFDCYRVAIDDTFGLYVIKASTEVMSHKDCLFRLEHVSYVLKSYYGESQKIMRLKDTPCEYMTSESPDTIVCYVWSLPECKKLEKEKVSLLGVGVQEFDQDTGAVRIEYYSDDFDKVMESKTPF